MLKKYLSVFLSLLIIQTGQAQYNKYIVRLKDKGSNPFSLSNPSSYLGPRAIERRTRQGIAIDSSDIPVTPRYIDSIRLSGNVIILNTSKWLNQVAIETTDPAALTKISSFPFVLALSPAAARGQQSGIHKFTEQQVSPDQQEAYTGSRLNGYYNYGRSNGQVVIHQGDFLHNHGFRGGNMQIAMLDGGFFNYQTLPTFDSVRLNNQILGTWDFVKNESSVNEDHPHGMNCFSTIAANMPGTFVGTAPAASFYLFRTEDVFSEYPIEEQNWAAGVEKADSLGVDVCSTSLGYYQFDDPSFDYTYADMNGTTSISARAAAYANRKGMLMVMAAGNEGNGSWRHIITPADADSVLTVGAVDTLGNVAGFSSYGPSSDGRIKPDVAAVGSRAIVASNNTGLPTFSSGTSFACPNMAGIATCLWQAFPEASNHLILQTLKEASTRYSNPNDRIGYGIPDAKKAFVMLQRRTYQNQPVLGNCAYQFNVQVKVSPDMLIILERSTNADSAFTPIHQFQTTEPYGLHDFLYSDDLSSITAPSVFYRLRMNIGTDTSYLLDSFAYTLPVCPVTGTDDIRINPNPFTDVMTIQTNSLNATDVTLTIFNSAGQRVHVTRFSQQAGLRTTTIPMQHMAKGVYFVTGYFNRKKISSRKVIHR